MSYLSWHVGMKVVCVHSADRIAAAARKHSYGKYPAADTIYTIREIRDDAEYRGKGIVLLLQEIDNSHLIGTRVPGVFYAYVEPGFGIENFRPVQTRKTDIAIFTAMLDGAKERERA